MNPYIKQSPMWLDIEKIFNTRDFVPVFRYEVQIHTDDEDLDIINVISFDRIRDYVSKVGDYVQFRFMMPFGMYVHRFYKKRHNLEVTVKRIKTGGAGFYDDIMTIREVERFKAVFIAHKNPHVNLKVIETLDEVTLDRQAPVEVTLQLLNRTLEPLRIKTVQGVFKDVKREDLIRAILGGESSKVLIDGKPGIDAIDIVEPHNEEKIKHIIFPNNTPVLAVPTFMQERHTGVYTGGIGNYLQVYKGKRTWFVYPLFDITRFDEPVEKVIFYSVPSQQYEGMDKTFRVDDKTVHIAAVGQKLYQDDGESSQMQSGVGFRQADANFFMDKPVKITPEGPVGIKKKINTEVAMKDRDDNLNYAPVAELSIGANKFSQYSRYLINNGARVDLLWYNSDDALLYPGMPCKYMYVSGNEIKEVKGVIIGCQSLSTAGTKHSGIKKTDISYSMTSTVTLFVEKFTDADAIEDGSAPLPTDG